MQLFDAQDLERIKTARKEARAKKHVAAPADWKPEPPAQQTPITTAKLGVLRAAFAAVLDLGGDEQIPGLMRKYNLPRLSAVKPQDFDNLHFDLVMLALERAGAKNGCVLVAW